MSSSLQVIVLKISQMIDENVMFLHKDFYLT